MLNESEKKEGAEVAQQVLDPFAIAAGLLRNDVLILVPTFIILSLSAFVPGLLSVGDSTLEWGVKFFDRFLQLAVASFIVVRWRRRFEHTKRRNLSSPQALLRIFVAGAVVWGALNVPLLGVMLASQIWFSWVCVVLFFVAAFWTFRFYFYFVTFGLLSGSVRDVSDATLWLSRRDPSAALRSLVAPLAVTTLVWGVLSLPSPDGRSLFWATVSSTTLGLFWILATYTGIAYTLVLIDEPTWRNAGLDPYRKERLRTLETQGRGSHFNWLSPRDGAKIFLLALCVIAVGMYQGLQAAPAPRISVLKCEAGNHKVSVVVELSDPQYKFRGFNPYAFSLRSQTGFDDVSSGLGTVSLEPGGEELTGAIPQAPDPIKLRIDFRSNKTQDALVGLDNMYLWYNLKPLFPVKASIAPSSPSQQSGENPEK